MNRIESMRDKAILDRLRDEFIEVSLLNKKLTWRIDYREVEKWKKALAVWGEPCRMVDTKTGEVVWSEETNLRRSCE